MTGIKAQTQMLRRHLTRIPRRPARQPRPKRTNFFKVRRPILNFSVENWANQRMLPDIGIKMSQQERQSVPTADPDIKALLFVCLIHRQTP